MAYYCGECIVWRGSSDENSYGERWCSFSRRYERSDQNTYGCKGFLYAGRAVLTEVCSILKLDTQPWFKAFDDVKETYLVPDHMNLLVDYCSIGPVLAASLHSDSNRESVAQTLMEEYLSPARKMGEKGQHSNAVNKYKEMIKFLELKYQNGTD